MKVTQPSQPEIGGKAGSILKPLHALKHRESKRISEYSVWRDKLWRFDQGVTINWDFDLPDGSRFTDPCHHILLDEFKRFDWSRLCDARDGRPVQPVTLSCRHSQVKSLSAWMVTTGRHDFSTLDADALQEFLDQFLVELENKPDLNDDIPPSETQTDIEEEATGEADEGADGSIFWCLYRALTLWRAIWLQSETLRGTGIPQMHSDPLQGKSAFALARSLTTLVIKRVPPLPDDVALPIMNEAHRWLTVRADDVIWLHERWESVLGDLDTGTPISAERAQQFGRFDFSVEPGASEPWHPPIECEAHQVGQKRRRTIYSRPATEIRRLIEFVKAAGMIAIQSETGMRPSEVCSIPAASDASSGDPGPVVSRPSKTGLNELFFINSYLHKTMRVATPAEWLAGSRPMGSDVVPGPVLAVQKLERLLAPWRRRASKPGVAKALFLTGSTGLHLPRDYSAFSKLTTELCRDWQRTFIEECVDLSGLPDRSSLGEDLASYRSSHGRCIKPTQWRKSYAMYVVRTDRRMIPAVAFHFKHVSLAVTEEAYIGTDIDLMRERNTQQARAAAAFMYRVVRGKEPAVGRIAKLIDHCREQIEILLGDAVGVVAIGRLEEWCAVRNIRAFSSPHSMCFIGLRPTEARCHKQAGTTHWSNKEPNYQFREPDLCNGCSCNGIDTEHADFWISRFKETRQTLLLAQRSGLTAGFRVIQERAYQSENLLRALDIPLPTIEV